MPSDTYIDSATKRVYEKLLKRGRSVRINRVDADGTAWYQIRFKRGNIWMWHTLAIFGRDTNWVKVQHEPRLPR